MSAPPYMPLFVGDYLADTTHLTVTEHGAYMLLLMAMWRADGQLPDDDAKLARFAKCTSGQWARIRSTILDFFEICDGVVFHDRLRREMTKHAVAVEQRRHAASNGGKAKARNSKKKALPDASSPLCQPEPEPDTEESKASSVVALPRSKPAKRCPADWTPSQSDYDVGAAEGFTPGAMERELAKFRDYQFATARADWSATFRNWLRKAAERNPRNPNERPSSNRPSGFTDAGRQRADSNFAGAALALNRRRGGQVGRVGVPASGGEGEAGNLHEGGYAGPPLLLGRG